MNIDILNNIEMTAFWGNDDASSTITVSSDMYSQLLEGAHTTINAESWYEGLAYEVVWFFSDGCVSIIGGDGEHHLIDLDIQKLIIE